MMAEDWNFYFAQVDGALASVFLDLSYGAKGVDAKRTEVVWLSLRMREPRADGLSGTAEADILFAIGDALDLGAQQTDARFVGRVTHNRLHDFFFYVVPSAREELERALKSHMTAFPDYTFEVGHRSDPDWSIYREYLYPTPRALSQIRDEGVLASLDRHGNDPSKVRMVDFDFEMSSAGQGKALVAWAKTQGFVVTDTVHEGEKMMVYLQREQDLLDIREELERLYDKAESLDGTMTGWGTFATQ